MSKYCVIKSCRAQAALTVITGEKITIHKFPQNDTLRQQWDNFVNFANHSTDFKSKSHLICSRHFDPSCYYSGRITSNAVPSITDKSVSEGAIQFIPDFSSRNLNEINEVMCPVVHSSGDPSPHLILNESADINDTKFHIIDDDVIPVEVVITEAQNDVVPVSSENNSLDFDEKMIYVENGCIGEDPLMDVSLKDVTDERDCASILSSHFVATAATTHQRERSPENSGEGAFERRKRTVYAGDLSPSDFSSPLRRKLNLDRLKDELSTSKNSLRVANQRLKRAEKKIETLKFLIARRVQMMLKQSSALSGGVSATNPLSNPAAPS